MRFNIQYQLNRFLNKMKSTVEIIRKNIKTMIMICKVNYCWGTNNRWFTWITLKAKMSKKRFTVWNKSDWFLGWVSVCLWNKEETTVPTPHPQFNFEVICEHKKNTGIDLLLVSHTGRSLKPDGKIFMQYISEYKKTQINN